MKKYLSLLFFVLALSLNAQRIPFDNYNIHNGLPQNSVFDIIQDHRGYLWFATQVGAARFDGHSFVSFYTTEGLPDNYVNCLLNDSRGQIWFGTDGGGIGIYDGNVIRTINRTKGLISDHVEELHEDRYHTVWVRTHYGISRLSSNDTVVSYSAANGLLHNNVICMFEDHEGRMWFGTQKGISVIDHGTITNHELDDVIWGIAQDSKGNYWIATQSSGIYRYDGKKFAHFTTDNGLANDIVISIFVDSHDHVWCGTYQGGVSMYDGHRFINHRENGLTNEVIMGFFEDSRGILWCRPNEDGIFRLLNGRFQHIDKKNNLVDNYILKIFEDNQQNIWFGTLGGGVSEYSKFSFEVFQDIDGLPDNSVFSVMADHTGCIWAGTNAGVVKFDGTQFTTLSKESGLPDYTITHILEDRQGNIWASSYSNLSLIRNNRITNYTDSTILSQKYIYDMAEDEEGGLWCGTEEGVCYFRAGHFSSPLKNKEIQKRKIPGILYRDGILWLATRMGVYRYDRRAGTWKHFTTREGMPSNKCRDITLDQEGDIWVATDGGLAHMHRADTSWTIRALTTRNGLESNTIYFVVDDGMGRIWAGHEKGLNRINLKDGKIRFYGSLEGFTPLETNQGAVTVGKNHELWIGTVAGLTHYNPLYERKRSEPPVTFLRRILLFNQDIDLTEYSDSIDPRTHLPINLVLPSSKNTITFEYIGIHFTIPQKVRYRYFLKNYDQGWSPLTNNNTVTYKKIPPGQYTFMVKAENFAGVWNEKPFTFSFRIQPPFYQTTWFILLMVLLALYLIYLIIKIREKQLIREKRILEEKVQERTREIEKQKSEIEKQRDQIAQQNREIKDSIHYAKRIQSAVLPDESLLASTVKDYFILFHPRDIVSGDFYWFYKHEQYLVVTAADCTGHGVPGAFMSMLGISLLNEIINKDRIFEAHKILNKLRDYIKQMLGQTGKTDEAKDGMDMALVVLDYKEKVIQYAGAYNPLILIRNHELTEYKGDKMPIGIQMNEKESFTLHVTEMIPGDRLYIYSDGYTDQFGGPHGGKFKTRPFKELLLKIHDRPMKEQWEILERTLNEWKGNEPQIDDILVIGIEL